MRSIALAVTLMTLIGSPLVAHGGEQFHGFYLAAGGGFAQGEAVSLSASSANGVFTTNDTPQGVSATVVAGYNLQFGSALIGIEGSARFGREHFAARQTNGFPFNAAFAGTEAFKISHESRASAHLSLRAGATLGNVLIFVQGGLGASEQFSRASIVGAGISCAPFAIPCANPIALPSSELEISRWVPSILIGSGIEVNYARVFGRVTVQAEGVLLTRGASTSGPNATLAASGDDVHWTARAGAAIGVRF